MVRYLLEFKNVLIVIIVLRWWGYLINQGTGEGICLTRAIFSFHFAIRNHFNMQVYECNQNSLIDTLIIL